MRPGLEAVDGLMEQIIEEWYERVKEHYVTLQDSRELGIEPEIKRFHEKGSHRIKFAREKELDVTYGLGVSEIENKISIESSVNNKSVKFEYALFMDKLQAHYWRSRHEKPFTDPQFDRFAYADLLNFEPRLGESVSLDIRRDKADIIRLHFFVNPRHEGLLISRPEFLRDLIEEYCLTPLKRIYAEAYRGN